MRATLTALCTHCIRVFTRVLHLTEPIPAKALRERLIECPGCGAPALPHHVDLTENPPG